MPLLLSFTCFITKYNSIRTVDTLISFMKVVRRWIAKKWLKFGREKDFRATKRLVRPPRPKAAIAVPPDGFLSEMWSANSCFSSPLRVTLASWRHFAAIRPPRDRYLNVPYRATPATPPCNKSDASSARPSPASRLAHECLLHLSCAYVHGCLLFSLPHAATQERRRHSFSGNARRSPGRRKRESPVLQSRSGGPEGRSSVTLRTIPRSFTSHSLFLAILLAAKFAFWYQTGPALPSSPCRLPASRAHRQPVSARVSFSSVFRFRSVKWILFGGSWTDLQWCTCTLELEPHRRT